MHTHAHTRAHTHTHTHTHTTINLNFGLIFFGRRTHSFEKYKTINHSIVFEEYKTIIIGKRRLLEGGFPHLETKAEIMKGGVKFK